MNRARLAELREQAFWHIAKGERLIMKQTKLIAHLKAKGRDTGNGEQLLRELELSQEQRFIGLGNLEHEWKQSEITYYWHTLLASISSSEVKSQISSSEDSTCR